MRTLHGNTLHGHSISVGAHAPIGIFTSHIHASLFDHPSRGCKGLASIQQFVKTFTRARTATGHAELYVARLLATLGSRSIQAYSERIENIARVCQHDVAGVLRKHSPDFTGEIDPLSILCESFPHAVTLSSGPHPGPESL